MPAFVAQTCVMPKPMRSISRSLRTLSYKRDTLRGSGGKTASWADVEVNELLVEYGGVVSDPKLA
jgi:hypothetical protein